MLDPDLTEPTFNEMLTHCSLVTRRVACVQVGFPNDSCYEGWKMSEQDLDNASKLLRGNGTDARETLLADVFPAPKIEIPMQNGRPSWPPEPQYPRAPIEDEMAKRPPSDWKYTRAPTEDEMAKRSSERGERRPPFDSINIIELWRKAKNA